MVGWAFAFLVIALLASLIGFTGIAAGAASMAKIVFLGALVVAVVGTIISAARNRNG